MSIDDSAKDFPVALEPLPPLTPLDRLVIKSVDIIESPMTGSHMHGHEGAQFREVMWQDPHTYDWYELQLRSQTTKTEKVKTRIDLKCLAEHTRELKEWYAYSSQSTVVSQFDKDGKAIKKKKGVKDEDIIELVMSYLKTNPDIREPQGDDLLVDTAVRYELGEKKVQKIVSSLGKRAFLGVWGSDEKRMNKLVHEISKAEPNLSEEAIRASIERALHE